MKTAALKRATPPNVQLQCPSCDKVVVVGVHDQIDGGSVLCRHCGFESVLTREFEEHSGKSRWLLEDPDADDSNGERR